LRQQRKSAVGLESVNIICTRYESMWFYMGNSTLFAEIANAFPGCANQFSDSFIEKNPDVSQLDESVDPHVAVPAYMAWCARNGHKPAELVHDYTVNALAMFGRSKNLQVAYLNFKHHCTLEQKEVVLKFLHWYLDPALLVNTEQVARSIRRWSAA